MGRKRKVQLEEVKHEELKCEPTAEHASEPVAEAASTTEVPSCEPECNHHVPDCPPAPSVKEIKVENPKRMAEVIKDCTAMPSRGVASICMAKGSKVEVVKDCGELVEIDLHRSTHYFIAKVYLRMF